MELRTKDNWLYIMMDRKGADIALVKNGLSADTLYNRFHSYKTSNPWLECVAICKTRKNQNLKKVEHLFHEYCNEHFEHVCGEWYIVRGEEEINKIATQGFNYFGKLTYRVKAKEMVNRKIFEMWG